MGMHLEGKWGCEFDRWHFFQFTNVSTAEGKDRLTKDTRKETREESARKKGQKAR